MPMAAARMKMAAASSRFHLENGRRGVVAQSTTTGMMIKPPAASADHQVAKGVVQAGSPRLILLASARPAAVTVAAIIAVGTKQTSANLAMPNGVANVSRPFDQRRSAHAPAKAA